jgi:hypothetical protein
MTSVPQQPFRSPTIVRSTSLPGMGPNFRTSQSAQGQNQAPTTVVYPINIVISWRHPGQVAL